MGGIGSLQVEATWQDEDISHDPCEVPKALSWGSRPEKDIGEVSSIYDQEAIWLQGRKGVGPSNYGNEWKKLKN